MLRPVWSWMTLGVLISMMLAGTSCPPQGNGENGSGENGNGENGGDSEVTTVDMRDVEFMPANVTITVGQTVRWINQDPVPHTTTSGNPGDADAGALWDSGLLTPGATYEFTFNDTGVFTYFCEVHPTIMRDATVTVEPAP